MRSMGLERIHQAAGVIYDPVVRTPLVRADLAGQPDLFLKLELLQPVGSFKIRGAYSAVRRLPPAARAGGVWTVSAGNAAQGVALAAERAHVICEGAAGCAVAAAISGRAGPGRTVAIVSGGNIDLPRFADLVGAC